MEPTLPPTLWAGFLTVLGIWLVTVVSPGPNFVATVHAAMSQSRRAGVLVAAGIAAGTTVWAAASLLGLGLLFQTAGWLYQIVKLAGAAYLVYLGLRLILAARVATGPQAAAPGPAPSGAQAFRRGLLTDLSNPKAAAFFTSLFAVAVPPAAPLWYQGAIILCVVAIAGGWYGMVACAMGSGRIAAAYRRAQRAIAYVTGALFVALGVRLAVER